MSSYESKMRQQIPGNHISLRPRQGKNRKVRAVRQIGTTMRRVSKPGVASISIVYSTFVMLSNKNIPTYNTFIPFHILTQTWRLHVKTFDSISNTPSWFVCKFLQDYCRNYRIGILQNSFLKFLVYFRGTIQDPEYLDLLRSSVIFTILNYKLCKLHQSYGLHYRFDLYLRMTCIKSSSPNSSFTKRLESHH